MDFVIALDGGGKRTLCAAIDVSGNLLTWTESSPSNPQDVGFQMSARTIYLAISDALLSIGMSPFSYRWSSVSISGIERSNDKDLLYKHIREIFGPDLRLSIHTDLEATFVSAFPNEGGILLMIEAASAAYSIAKGEQIQSGGWGPILDEEGSGYWMGKEVLRAAMQSYDGRSPATTLETSILDWLSIENPSDLIGWARTAKREEVASLAPLVLGAAKSGDPIALEILKRSAHELAKMVWAVWKKSGLRIPVDVGISGGIVKSDSFLSEAIGDELKKMGLETRRRIVAPNALSGAAILALRSAGIVLTDELLSKIESATYSIYK